MKKLIIVIKSFIVFVLVFIIPNQTFSQKSIKVKEQISKQNYFTLVAKKDKKETVFHAGTAVRMMIKTSKGDQKIIRGYITDFAENELTVEPFHKNSKFNTEIINPEQIENVRKLSRRQRKSAAFALGGAAVYSGVMLLLIGETGPLSYILFIPAFGVALGFVYYYPATFIIDLLNEKKTDAGWGFSIQRR